MNLKDVQTALNARGWKPALNVDGTWGAKTRDAVAGTLDKLGVAHGSWGDERMRIAAMQAVCRLDGIEVGVIDGLSGPQTRYAIEVWDARRVETWRDTTPSATPATVKTVWPTQAGVRKFYGEPGQNQAMLKTPYPMRLAWDTDATVSRFSIHERVHDSAVRVLDRALDHYGLTGIRSLGLDLFGGCLNVRAMRGGSALSMHAWGIAIDIDPDRNQLKWGRDLARLGRPDAARWFDLWAEEGWVSLGRAANYDWMHVQAARL